MISGEKATEISSNVPDEVTDHAIVWGGPEHVAERLQTYIDAGINEIVFMNMSACADPEYGAHWNEQASKVLQLLGREPLKLDAPGAQA